MKYHFRFLNEVRPIWRLYGIWMIPLHAVLLQIVEVTEDGDYERILPLFCSIMLHSAMFLLSKWFPQWRRFFDMKPSLSLQTTSHIEVVRKTDSKCIGVVPLSRTSSGVFYIERKCKRMYYNEKLKSFEKIRPLVDAPVNHYLSLARNPLPVGDSDGVHPTSMDIPVPEFFDLFKEHVLEPFFVFQVFCVLLWLMDEYWNYALLTLFMLILLEAQMVKRRIKDLTELRRMKPTVRKIRVKRNNGFVHIDSDHLVHGDIVELSSPQNADSEFLVPADILITSGSVLVNESMLTGESVPVLKEAILPSDFPLDIQTTHRHSTLFAGSAILSTTGPAVGVVLRTGFDTSQGKLIRTILFSSERVSASSKEAYKFILVLFSVAVISASYVLYEGLNDRPVPRRRFKLFLSVSHILTSVIPPEFPITMSLTVTLSLVNLIKNSIYCTEPFRIPFAGNLKTCCFDKTGTLTSTDMIFEKISSSQNVDESLLILAACNSLTFVGDRLVGDPIEIAAYSGACVPGGFVLKNSSIVTNTCGSWRIETRYPFDPSLQRMSVILVDDKTKTRSVLSKGSPESLRALLANVPSNYDEECASLASRGYRVLAMAICENFISDSHNDREKIERIGSFKFAGFVSFSYSIKANTIRTIESLNQSGHACVMITGDHMLTAVHVARQVGILSLDEFQIVKSTDNIEHIPDGVPLCVEGCPSRIVAAGLVHRVKVFARSTPAHKRDIVATLSGQGNMCLFCGDGTNDVAALKQAAVGIALMSSSPQRSPKSAVIGKLRNSGIVSEDSTLPAKPGDASIAAPFVYRGDTIRCVTLLVRSGRAALALVIQMYKILAVNSLITAFSLSVMTLRGVKLGDSQTAVEAVLMSIVSFMFSRFPPAKHLPTGTKFQPVYSVFRPSVMMSIFGQSLLHLALLAHGQFRLLDQTVETIDLDAKFSPSLPNTIAFLQLCSAHLSSMVANFEGPPSLPSLQSSRPVLVLVGSMIITILSLSSGVLPGDFLELVEIENEVTQKLVMLVLGHIAGGICIGVGIRNFFERP